MSNKNYSKLLEKRQRIKKTTLVVGVDIGYKFNAVALINKAGDVLAKYDRVYNSRKGFDYYHKVIEKMKKKHGFKDVLIGMEPTGHYWRKLAYFSKDLGYEVRFIRTSATKYQRELDESSSAKNDLRDAVTISQIVREGKYLDTVIKNDEYYQLRTLAKVRERILRYNNGNKNALRAVIDDYFPELTDIFWSMDSKGLWGLLEHAPFPEDVLKLDMEQLSLIIGKPSKRLKQGKEKAEMVYKTAQESIGLKKIGEAEKYKVKMYLTLLKQSDAQLKDIKKQMEKILETIPENVSKRILSLPGIGQLSAAIILGELGNPKNFTNPKQMIKYIGLDPKEKDSGMWMGRKKISKKGRWLIRKYLFQVTLRVVYRSSYFKKYYQRKLKNKNRYGQNLSKKEAICAVTIKLIKVMFSVLKNKRDFTEKAPLRLAEAA